MGVSSRFHEGELAVQTRARVREQASRVGGIIDMSLSPAEQAFLAYQPFAIVASIGAHGRPWASMLTGSPGFLSVHGMRTVRVDARPVPGDPLAGALTQGVPLGLLVIDPATRRRVRINGSVEASDDAGFALRTHEVFGNCQKYIQRRAWGWDEPAAGKTRGARHGTELTPEQAAWVDAADTFFIASTHPSRGADASHRGGNPGFVRVEDGRTLVWPDYQGNNMFQTLGNLAVDPHAGLLFLDFELGSTLQLSGRARVDWDPLRASTFPGAARLIDFTVEEVVEIAAASPLRWRFGDYSRFNPD